MINSILATCGTVPENNRDPHNGNRFSSPMVAIQMSWANGYDAPAPLDKDMGS